MARGLNKAMIIGNLGNDPEIRYTPSGSAVANITVATTDTWRDKQTGDLQERTEWHRIVFFNRLAEIVGEYLHKGSKVYIEGSMRTRKWQDKSGNDRHTTEIIANEMQMLDSRGSGGGNSGNYQRQNTNQDQGQGQGQGQGGSQQGKPASTSMDSNDDFDDDIPF